MRPSPCRATAFRTQSILFLTVLMSCAGLAQKPFVPAPHKPVPPLLPQPAQWHSPATPRSVVGGLWRTDANYKSAIYIHNGVQASPLHVIPVLYVSNGTRLALPEVTLEPTGIAVVDINAALQQQGIAAWATLSGYVEVDYQWPWDALCVTVRNVDPIHSELFNFGLGAGPQNHAEGQSAHLNTIEGLWWKHERNVSGFVAVSNMSAEPINATLEVSDAAARSLGAHALAIPPHETNLFNLLELQSAATANGGIRVTWEGHGDELAVNGGLEDPAIGYSANIPLRPLEQSAAAPAPRTYAELGLMTGAADPMMRFPVNTTFTPYSVLRNASAQTISATPTLWWMQGGAARSARLPQVAIAPYHSVDLAVPALLAAAGLAHFNGEVNLALDVQGPPRQLLLAGGSVDQSGTYVFAVTPIAILESVGKTAGYWSTGNGDDTMVTLWNPADEGQDFAFRLFFSGGRYTLPVHLEPRATSMLNLSDVVNSGIPDAEGNRIPAGLHEGAAELTGSLGGGQHILVAMDLGTYNVQKATCGNQYCITCQGATTSWITADPFSVAVTSSSQLTFKVQYHTGQQYDYTSSGTWSSSDTSLATVSAGLVNGVGAGSVTVYASADVPDYSSGCYSYAQECPIGSGQNSDTTGTTCDFSISPSDRQGYCSADKQLFGVNPSSSACVITSGDCNGAPFTYGTAHGNDMIVTYSNCNVQPNISATGTMSWTGTAGGVGWKFNLKLNYSGPVSHTSRQTCQ